MRGGTRASRPCLQCAAVTGRCLRSTLDRALEPIREQAGSPRRRRQKRRFGNRVPIRTFDDWDEPEPGYLEIDLVAPCGGSVAGSFTRSHAVTDVCSGWTEAIPRASQIIAMLNIQAVEWSGWEEVTGGVLTKRNREAVKEAVKEPVSAHPLPKIGPDTPELNCPSTQLLIEHEGLDITPSTLRRLLASAGEGGPRGRHPRKHRVRRQRMPRECMLFPLDSSYHRWLGEHEPQFTLLLAVADATGIVINALFYELENTHRYFLLLEGLIGCRGIPPALYAGSTRRFQAYAVERWIRTARFAAVRSLDTFTSPAVNRAMVMELTRIEYIGRGENIIVIGNSGAAKTNMASGPALAACYRGMSVGFTTAPALAHELTEARDERRLLNLQRQLSRLNLLIIDEPGQVTQE